MNRRDAIRLGLLSPLAAVAAAKGAAVEALPESPALAMLQAAEDWGEMVRIQQMLRVDRAVSELGYEWLVWASIRARAGGTVPACCKSEELGFAHFCARINRGDAFGAIVLDGRKPTHMRALGRLVSGFPYRPPVVVPRTVAGVLIGVEVVV